MARYHGLDTDSLVDTLEDMSNPPDKVGNSFRTIKRRPNVERKGNKFRLQWTEAQIELLKELFPKAPYKELIEKLAPHASSAIFAKAVKLGIRRESQRGYMYQPAPNTHAIFSELRRIRIHTGYTQSDVAKQLGYKYRSLIQRAESGKFNMPFDKLVLWAALFGYEIKLTNYLSR